MNPNCFPPKDPPLPLKYFTNKAATWIEDFNPGPVNRIFRKHAAGLMAKPTAEQLRDWMNEESEVPEKYHPAIMDTIAKMRGEEMMTFRENNGSSIRGFAHLVHATQAYTDRVVHYIDQWSDIGDPRPRWDGGYTNAAELR